MIKIKKYDQITYENLEEMVASFYSKIKNNSKLEPIFNASIGASRDSWKEHEKIITNFWSDMMLSTALYKKNLIKPHTNMPRFDISLFEVWLDLFSKTVCDLYTKDLADLFIMRASRVSESLKLALYFKPKLGNPKP